MVFGVKRKIYKSVKSKWNPLQLNESLLSSGIEGLVGIEELTDYSIVINKKRNYNYEEISKPKLKVVRVRATSNAASFANDSFDRNELPPHNTELVVKKKKNNKKTKTNKNAYGVEIDTSNLAHNSENAAIVKKKKKPKRVEKKSKQNIVNTAVNKTEYVSNPVALKRKLSISTYTVTTDTVEKKTKTLGPTEENNLEVDQSKPVQSSRKKKLKLKKKHNILTSTDTLEKNTNSAGSTQIKTLKVNTAESGQSSNVKSKTKKVLEAKKNIKKNKRNKLTSKQVSSSSVDDKLADFPPVQGMEGWGGLNLPESILRALAENGFTEPTEIQARSLPAALLGRRDIMGAAETGSGKTLAFGIPIIYGILQQKKNKTKAGSQILEEEGQANSTSGQPQDSESSDENEDVGVNAEGFGCVRVIDDVDMDAPVQAAHPHHNEKLYALVLTPTRELAVQVKDHIAAAAKYTGIRVSVVIGGLAAQKQERLLRTKPEIVVATPGRLWELIQEGNSYLQQVDNISFLAIDETDRMTEKGHFQELRTLLERINADPTRARRRQNFVFSATLTMVHDPPQRKKGKNKMRVTPGQKLQDVVQMIGITKPKIVDVTQKSGMSGTLEEAQIRCTFSDKDIYLYYFLLRHPGRTLVFCNSISCVRRLAQLLTLLQSRPLPIHANMMQKQRLRNLDKFRESPTGLLLATDVAARGLDIPDVQHVVHYQVPRTSETYVHRSGRTARASKEGLTLVLIEPEENQAFTRLCRTLGRAKELPELEVSQDLFTAAKQRMVLARDIDQLELTTRRSEAEIGWFQKAMTDMDMVLDKDDLPMRISKKESAGNKKVSAVKRKELATLLSRPLFAMRK